MAIGTWFQQTLANVAGTAEPIYGPEAIQSVAKQAETTPHTVLSRDDLKWRVGDTTNVETQTFYLFPDSGGLGMVQVIYSNVGGIRVTSQFNTKIFNHATPGSAHLWSSDPLEHLKFSADKTSLTADNLSVTLAADGSNYAIKSSTNKQSIVDLTVSREADGFVAGKDGTSYYGTDPKKPWASMRHAFWPKCSVQGTIITQSGPVDFKGKAVFIHALQAAKPHHLASRWNFLTFQSPSYSAVLMSFTTPPSYGSTSVTVGSLVSTTSSSTTSTTPILLLANTNSTATHTATAPDSQTEWSEPTSARYTWEGTSASSAPGEAGGKKVSAILEGPLGPRLDRVDVMAEVPGFVKQIVAAAAGTKPYIYQYNPRLKLKVTIDGEETEEEGLAFTEATFIS